jgi:enoyl-CoA hydratase/carnithine racemase
MVGGSSGGPEDVAAVLENSGSLLVVDLDAEEAIAPLAVGYAGVVVGISRSGRAAIGDGPPIALDDLDILVVPADRVPTGPSRGAAWVAVEDPDAELRRLSQAMTEAPMAAVALMQVLRAGEPGSIEHDLVLESLAYSTLQAGSEFQRWRSARPPVKPHRAQVGPPVILERSGAELTITLNRPQVRNAYNVELRDGLFEAFDLVDWDPSIESVELRGAGVAFSSGGDLDEFGTGPGPAVSHLIRVARGPVRGLGRVAGRVTAFLHGACVGAGVEIPALAGRVVAAPDTQLRLPEVAMGLIPGAGGTATIPRRIGRHRTAWLALGGTWLDAGTALTWGLVDEVRPRPDPA